MAIEKLPNHYSMTNPASVYDEEALTAIELAGRTTAKLNEVVEDQNDLRNTTETKLEKFEKETIPKEVSETVLEHIADGEFDKQINHYLGDVDDRLESLLHSMPEGSTRMDAEVIDARIDSNGSIWENLGMRLREREDTVPFPKTAQLEKADFLVDYHDWYGRRDEYLGKAFSPLTMDMKFFTPGTIVFGNNMTVDDFTHLPELLVKMGKAPSQMIIEGFGEKQNNISWGTGLERFQLFIKQTLICNLTNPQQIGNGNYPFTWSRYLFFNTHLKCWVDLTPWEDGSRTYEIYEGTAEEVQKKVDFTVEPKTAIVAVGGVNPIPENGWLLKVEPISTGWIIHHAYGLANNPRHLYRIGHNAKNLISKEDFEVHNSYDPDVQYSVDWSDWKEPADMKTVEEMIKAIPSGGSGAPLPWAGKTIVFFGDSICGNFRDATGVCAQVEKLTGATVKNFCFGGTRIRSRDDDDCYRVQDLSILVRNYLGNGGLEEAIQTKIDEGCDVPQDYWREVAREIDSFDFSTVDLFVIVSGTNDIYSYGEYWRDTEPNLSDTALSPDDYETTVKGSLFFVIEALQSLGKGRVLYVAPNYRNDLETLAEYYDFPLTLLNGESWWETSLDTYCDNLVEPAIARRASYLTPHEEIGINRANWSNFGEDDVHLNAEGRAIFGRYIAGKINQM